nr:MAG TPA: hypothetical protein [Caudoviricetes sp.]
MIFPNVRRPPILAIASLVVSLVHGFTAEALSSATRCGASSSATSISASATASMMIRSRSAI